MPLHAPVIRRNCRCLLYQSKAANIISRSWRCWTAWVAPGRESVRRSAISSCRRINIKPWWKPRSSPRKPPKRIRAVARSRAKPPSLEEMLQTLKVAFRGRLVPPLGGFVYRFTIFLPLLSEGREVFTRQHRSLLADLFYECMEGFTEASSEGHPPWYGSWAPLGAEQAVID